MTQPEALRLADELADPYDGMWFEDPRKKAAAELRRLHKENKKLRKALAQPEQEPVDWEAVAADQAMTIAMMKTENREWVGLTDEKIYEHEWWDEETAYAVNKFLMEKNT